jgi:PAS domain S-box-containing protein
VVEVNEKSQPGKVQYLERSEPHFISLNETILRDKLLVILYYALDLLDSSAGLVALWSDKDKLFIEKVSYGLGPDEINYLRSLLQEAIPNLAENRTNSGLLSQLNLQGQATTMTQKFGAIMATPLEIDNKMIGLVMVLRSNSAKPFEAGDQRLLYSYDILLSNSIHNTILLYQLAERQHKIDAMQEMSSDGFITIDSKRRIVSFNTAMEKLIGWKKKEVIGRYCFDVLKICDSKGVNLCQTKCPVADGTEGLCHIDGIINSKDGQKVDVTVSYSLARLPAGEIWAVLNILDVSRLRQAKDLRSMLLAAVSHELQTPISIIKAYASILTRPDTHWDEKIFRDKLVAIEEESDRLSGMINKLLFSSRLEVGEFSLNRLLFDLPKQAQKVVKRFSGKTSIHRIKIDFPADFPPIFADPEKIEDVLINLVENSIKFSPRGGAITIKGEVARNRVLVTVSDEGIGIPLRDHEYIFDLFYRVEDGPARLVKGTGLGLYICKTIIEAHGGRIWVESELGRGTRITFSMPIQGNN